MLLVALTMGVELLLLGVELVSVLVDALSLMPLANSEDDVPAAANSAGMFANVANPFAFPCIMSLTVACGRFDICLWPFELLDFCTLAGFVNDPISPIGVVAEEELADFGKQ
jgi:hypothetical protein